MGLQDSKKSKPHFFKLMLVLQWFLKKSLG